MIKVYILVLLWGSPQHYDAAKAVHSLEFTSLAKCQAVSYEISKKYFRTTHPPVMICAEK